MADAHRLYRLSDNSEVTLPAALDTFRGERVTVTSLWPSRPGTSGRIILDTGREYYPSVVNCYIAPAPMTGADATADQLDSEPDRPSHYREHPDSARRNRLEADGLDNLGWPLETDAPQAAAGDNAPTGKGAE